MNGIDVSNKIKEIIIRILNLEIEESELVESDLIQAYGINSVDALEILIHVENEFEITVDEDDLNADLINSIATLSAYVEQRIH